MSFLCVSDCVCSLPGSKYKLKPNALLGQQCWSARGYSGCQERKKQKDGDRHEKLEEKDDAGRLWQYEYNATCVRSQMKAQGWNPHTKTPIILLARYNTIGWSDLYCSHLWCCWIGLDAEVAGGRFITVCLILGQCVSPKKTPWQP